MNENRDELDLVSLDMWRSDTFLSCSLKIEYNQFLWFAASVHFVHVNDDPKLSILFSDFDQRSKYALAASFYEAICKLWCIVKSYWKGRNSF